MTTVVTINHHNSIIDYNSICRYVKMSILICGHWHIDIYMIVDDLVAFLYCSKYALLYIRQSGCARLE